MRLGSFDWAEATAGKLTGAERRSFIGPALRQSLQYAVGRLRLTLGMRRHASPGFDIAMVDLTGQRLWDLSPDFVDGVLSRYPRLDMKKHLTACWRAEADTFREGRAAFIEKVLRFSLFVRLAPFGE